ncbi:oxidoreductase HTATIP2-like [Lineus longissimus]|uniref:oxidoreductase HTATIP2-like n=1 Tax=Lineus longissimus TaxID=88925 RepID=UPI002B4E2A28
MDFLQFFSIVVALLAVLLASVIVYLELTPSVNEKTNLLMAAAASDENNVESFKGKNMSAFIVGYTGETGKVLVRECLQRNIFKKLVLIGRREVKYNEDIYKDVEQRIVDFENLGDYSEAFKDIHVGFVTLGTTRGKAGVEGFKRVDYDYVVKTAELAKQGGCQHFNLLSSQGANKNSFLLYQMVKGEAEETVSQMMFKRLTIYRPGLLLCDREEHRTGEKIFNFLLKPVAKCAPTVMTVPTTTVAKAMVNAVVAESSQPIQILENKDIHQLAGNAKK